MCIDGNSAPLSEYYIKSQFAALWQNASNCAKSMTGHTWADYEKSKYTRALAQFHYYGRKAPKPQAKVSNDDFRFSATFGTPDIKFVCNHDAILFLRIDAGAHVDLSKIIPGARVTYVLCVRPQVVSCI